MLIAHLPAGYLIGAPLKRRWPAAPGVVAAALIGSVLPDADMIWFLLAGGHTHHHDYVTHWPLAWAAAAALVLPASWLAARRWFPAAVAFFAGILSHMALDTIAAPIMWLAPFSERRFELVAVPATQANWVLSFVLHWTFLLELAICLAAFVVWRADAPDPKGL